MYDSLQKTRVPQELMDYSLEFLGDSTEASTEALNACAIASRRLLDTSRRLRFETLHIRADPRPQRLLEFYELINHAPFARCIRELTIEERFPSSNLTLSVWDLEQLVTRLVSLHTLTLSRIRLNDDKIELVSFPYLNPSAAHRLPSLRSLTLDMLLVYRYHETLPACLYLLMPQELYLVSLSIGDNIVSKQEVTTSLARYPVKYSLVCLDLDDETPELLEAVVPTLSRDTVRTLSIGNVTSSDPEDVEATFVSLGSLITHIAPSLTKLICKVEEFQYEDASIDPSAWRMLRLSRTSITEFAIRISIDALESDDDDPWDSPLGLISTLPPSVQIVKFLLRSYNTIRGLSRNAWLPKDEFRECLGRLPALKAVVFNWDTEYQDPSPECRAELTPYIKELLPDLDRRGLLHVDLSTPE